jgi:hypothetical protein
VTRRIVHNARVKKFEALRRARVPRVTNQGSPDFVPTPERVAVFDNDGTLWSEQPMYIQLTFAPDLPASRSLTLTNGKFRVESSPP